MPATSSRLPQLPVGYVTHAVGVGYFVKSRTTEGAWWLVRDGECTCPAGQDGRRCWHVRQVDAFVRAVNDEQRRPIAPPNVSALVD